MKAYKPHVKNRKNLKNTRKEKKTTTPGIKLHAGREAERWPEDKKTKYIPLFHIFAQRELPYFAHTLLFLVDPARHAPFVMIRTKTEKTLSNAYNKEEIHVSSFHDFYDLC